MMMKTSMYTPSFFVAALWMSQWHVSVACPGALTKRNASEAQILLAKAIDAIGGQDTLSRISGLSMFAPDIFRSQTLTQTYSLNISDVFLASRGSQNVSFKYSPDCLQQSIDREYSLDSYWLWAIPSLNPPVSFSLVVDAGNSTLAFFRNGTNSLVSSPGDLGFADSGLTQYLAGEAKRSDPLLAFWLSQKKDIEAPKLVVSGIDVPAIFDPATGTTLALYPNTFLPWFVRRDVHNKIFGHTTNDIFFTDYKKVNFSGSSVLLPHRRQMLYNNEIVEDTIFVDIVVNPNFPSDQFVIQPSSDDMFTTPHMLNTPSNWTVDDIGPFYEAAMWSGEFSRILNNVTASHPIPDLPQLWHLDFSDSDGNPGGYAQLVVEVEDGVLVADSPHHLSRILLEWIAEEIGKPVKYLWPSHHHHDHAYGSADYVAVGAKMIVPAVAGSYWSQIPNVTLITFDETRPFVLADDKVQVRALWRPDAPHAEDWSWLLVTNACPREGDNMVVFEADAWTPDDMNLSTDMALARQWLDWLAEDGISNNTIVTAAHGGTYALQKLIDILGYPYPKHGLMDFGAGGNLCFSS